MEVSPLVLLGGVIAILIVLYWLVRGSMPAEGSDIRLAALYEIAKAIEDRFYASASPADLLNFPDFVRGVTHLNAGGFSNSDLMHYYRGDNNVLSCMALEALTRRDDRHHTRQPLLDGLATSAPWVRYFALRALSAGAAPDEPLIGALLAKLNASWNENFSFRFLQEFIKERVDLGERLELGKHVNELNDRQAAWLVEFLPSLEVGATEALIGQIQSWRDDQIDIDALNAIGSVWDASTGSGDDPPIEHEQLLAHVAHLETEMQSQPPRSFLVVGDTGVGKSAVVQVLGRRLQQKGWTVFQAGHTELMAGMTYIGQLEERLKSFAQLLGGRRRVLWVVPDFYALSWAGRHKYEKTSLLDTLLPFIERGEIVVVGECTPEGYQRLLMSKPRCRAALEIRTIEPLGERASLELARTWAGRNSDSSSAELMSAGTLEEAWNLTCQFQGDTAPPGNLLQLLKLTLRRLTAAGRVEGLTIGLDDLILTLGQLTGLPASILDEREQLDLKALRGLFERRVMGQPEGVECLVSQVAMIKAGLTDPSRPQGVFLFAGPTGTGKTEIAKTLAEFLFGSPDRLIRIDMSELQGQASLDRILGDPNDKEDAGALTDLVRKQPFSVLLLDEFEKSHPRIWDVFLQVFDDGRLTDRFGRTVDFRHTLIIMTSNLGSEIPAGLGLGFVDRQGTFSEDAVLRVVRRSFRREFLNRIDRVVVFRPLTRETMRQILHKELDAVFKRRGLRSRSWLAEWDESAVDFLLERGFTADLGARPLRRAIERYLLAPLAITIVNHQFPEGDQFLFIRGTGDELAVEFVDPAAPTDPPSDAPVAGTAPAESAAADGRVIEDVVLSPHGSRSELTLLRRTFDGLRDASEAADFKEIKQSALQSTNNPAFWESAERFALLGRAEYLDRIESGLRSAESLLRRLEDLNGETLPKRLVGRLAQRLFLLERACEGERQERPRDAYIVVEAGHEAGPGAVPSNDFARLLGEMYRSWGAKRGMRCAVIDEGSDPEDRPYHLLLSVSGYAAYALLEHEAGLHVFELPREDRRPARRKVARVQVAAQSEGQPARNPAEQRQEARRDLANQGPAPTRIVRHYREDPSPLVRDGVRGWRTGKLERVLAGDFDIIR